MGRRRFPFPAWIFCLLMAALSSGCDAPARAADATILRDRFGVPHIFAATEEAGMYAFGYAQAEDRLEALLRNVKQARGELSELDGPGALPGDLQARAFRLDDFSHQKYATLSAPVRADIEAFCAGIARFQRDHPEKRPAWAFDVAPTDIVTLAQFINLAFARDPFERLPVPVAAPAAPGAPPSPTTPTPGAPFRTAPVVAEGSGSNAFAVAAGRTASGKGVIVSLDPHLPWHGLLRWYEAHLSCGPMNVAGITFVGVPLILMGHNERVAWANTVNAPDLSDWYEERLLPADKPVAYAYDNGQRPLERQTFTIRVRQPDGTLQAQMHTIAYTHHGPLLLTHEGKFYAARKAGWGDLGMLEQVRVQGLAGDAEAYKKTLAGRHVVMFSHIFGDVTGRIGFVWGGQIPRRTGDFDFHGAVPGWLKASEWGDPVPFDELPQASSPPGGFLQNCNDGPRHIAPDAGKLLSAPPNGYPAWLAPDVVTLRGARLTTLLTGDAKITPEDAQTIATDVLDLVAARQLPALLDAVRATRNLPESDRPLVAECLKALAAWDLRRTSDARGAALFAAWLSHPMVAPLVQPEPAPPAALQNPDECARALVASARRLALTGRAPDVAWGEVHRHQRGTVDLPLDGGGDSLTPTTDVPGTDGRLVAAQGSSFRMIVEMGNGPIRAWSYAPYGNSDDPASPHFADQMSLAAKRQYRRVPFTRAEVEAEATAQKTLPWPEP